MTEATLRAWHRNLGKALAALFLLQAASGLYLTVQYGFGALGAAWPEVVAAGFPGGWLAAVHHGGGALGLAYRLAVGVGLIAQTCLGGAINLKVMARKRAGQ